MALFTDLFKLAVALYALWELRAIRRAFTPASVKSPVERFQEAVVELADQVVGPTLPPVTSDEDELAVEREQYHTFGAAAGYHVTPHWLEQDERDAYLEEEEAMRGA